MDSGRDERRSMAAYIAKHGRIRPSHAVRNDASLSASIVDLIASGGWDALTISGVAANAGLTHGAVYDRHQNKSALGVDAWHDNLFRPLTDVLDEVLNAALGAQPNETADERFLPAMRVFVDPTTEMRAAIELVMGSQFDPVLRAAVFDGLAEWLGSRCLAYDGDRSRAAGASSVVALALGFVLLSRRPWVDEMDIGPGLRRIFVALRNPSEARILPADTADFLRTSPFDTGDPRLDDVLDRTIASIGSVGYRQTRVADIAKASGVSEGFIFSRYKTKLDLFLAVIDFMHAQGYQRLGEFIERIAREVGPGAAEAVAWREYLSPGATTRVVFLETQRLVSYNERMRAITDPVEQGLLESMVAGTPDIGRAEVIGHVHLEFASGHGLPLLGVLLPSAWELPYDVFTEPFVTSSPLA